MARLKSSARLVKAIEKAVRFYEEPPTSGMTVTAHGSDIWVGPDDWATAFEAPDPGTPHNEARDEVWEELLTILVDRHGEDEGDTEDATPSADLLRKSLQQNGSCSRPSTAPGP